MSFQAMTWAIEQPVGSAAARCILMSIANYANAEWCCWPKQETIARESVLSVDTVQRRVPELIGACFIRRIKLKRFGRRIHDFYILRPSPYFEASLEDIRPLLPGSCDVIEEVESSTEEPSEHATAKCGSGDDDETVTASEDSPPVATAKCGSAQNPVLPHPAVDATALVRQQEPVTNQSKIPSPTPSKEGALKNQPQLSEAAEQRFREFKAAYPDGIVDVDKAQREFAGLADADQSACVTAAPVYAARCRKRREKSKKAHLFIRERAWVGLLAASDPKNIGAAPTQHPPGTPSGRALLALARIASYSPLRFGENVSFIGEITPRLLALANAPDRVHWVRYERGSAHYAAWRDFGGTIWPGRGFSYDWIDAPWPWPPRKDGSIIKTTDPPGEANLSAEDIQALSG